MMNKAPQIVGGALLLIAKLFEYLPVHSVKSGLNLNGLDPAVPPFHETAITWVDVSLNLMTPRKEGRRN